MFSSLITRLTESLLEVRRVDQAPRASRLLQRRTHNLDPQRSVQTYNIVDVAEEARGLHLTQQTVVLKTQQDA